MWCAQATHSEKFSCSYSMLRPLLYDDARACEDGRIFDRLHHTRVLSRFNGCVSVETVASPDFDWCMSVLERAYVNLEKHGLAISVAMKKSMCDDYMLHVATNKFSHENISLNYLRGWKMLLHHRLIFCGVYKKRSHMATICPVIRRELFTNTVLNKGNFIRGIPHFDVEVCANAFHTRMSNCGCRRFLRHQFGMLDVRPKRGGLTENARPLKGDRRHEFRAFFSFVCRALNGCLPPGFVRCKHSFAPTCYRSMPQLQHDIGRISPERFSSH